MDKHRNRHNTPEVLGQSVCLFVVKLHSFARKPTWLCVRKH